MVPINFLRTGETADYVITGAWGKRPLKEAKRCGNANVIFSTADEGFKSVPEQAELNFSPNAKYIHYTSNETIEGVEFKYDLDGSGIPVVCDASSNILSKPLDIEKYASHLRRSAENIGPSGVTLVIIRDDLVAGATPNEPVDEQQQRRKQSPAEPQTHFVGLLQNELASLFATGITDAEKQPMLD